MTDIRSTPYLTKPNVETTRYFTPTDPSIEIWDELNKKEYITDHNADINEINESIAVIDNSLTNLSSRVSTNESDISTINENITTLDTSVSNISSRVSTAESDIDELQAAISGLSSIEYEGMYKYVTDSISGHYGVMLNFKQGGMLYWNDNRSGAVLNNVDNQFTLNSNIQSLTLPGYYKSSDGQNVYTNLIYYIDAPSSSSTNPRKTLNNLKSITTEPGVLKIDFNLSAAPSLRYFNLMEGLEEINIIGTKPNSSTSRPDLPNIINLRIPSSVKKCTLKDLFLGDLIFEGYTISYNGVATLDELDLSLNNVWVCDTLYCVREIKTLSTSNMSYCMAPRILQCSFGFLQNITSTSLGTLDGEGITTTTLYLHQPLEDITSLTNTLHFKRIINETKRASSVYSTSNLEADTWIG